jgi:hypothetical protein
MEVYQEATDYTVSSIKKIIDTILKIAQSDKKCDDLFNVFIDYDDMLEEYFEEIEDSCKDEELKHLIDKVSEDRDLTLTEVYNKCSDAIISSGFPTIEQYVETYDDGWGGCPRTEVKIIPKDSCTKEELEILDRINSLFNIEAQYDG